MDLYSAFKSEDIEAFDSVHEDEVSLNRWVFKWHLQVKMFSHSRMSAGRVPTKTTASNRQLSYVLCSSIGNLVA